MTDLDDELIPEVFAIVAELGKNMSFAVAVQTYSATTGKTTDVVTTHVWKCSPPFPVTDTYRMGMSAATDRMAENVIYAPAQGIPFVPALGQKVTFDGQTLTLVEVKSLYSGDLVACYVLGVRA